MSKMATEHEHIITDAELDALFGQWKIEVKQNGKYREAYREYTQDRLAAARAKMEY